MRPWYEKYFQFLGGRGFAERPRAGKMGERGRLQVFCDAARPTDAVVVSRHARTPALRMFGSISNGSSQAQVPFRLYRTVGAVPITNDGDWWPEVWERDGTQ